MKFEVGSFRERKIKGLSFQRGHKAEEKALSLGFYAVNRSTILTPISDKFPAQAFDLKVSKLVVSKNSRNVSAIEM